MIKIGILNIFSGQIGGGEIYYKDICLLLSQQKNIELKVITPKLNDLDFNCIKEQDIIHIQGIEKNNYKNSLLSILSCVKEIRKLLYQYNFDILIINGDRAVTLSPFLNLKNTKVIGIRHMPIDSSIKSYLSKISFYKINTLVTISEFHKKNYLKKTNTQTKIKVIYNSVDFEKFPFTLNKKGSEINYLFIGTLEMRKGILDLVQTFKLLIEKYDDINLNIVGDGPLFNEINEFIKINNLCEKVKLHGHQTNVYSYIKNNHILILPSYNEGLPLVVLESFSVGRAVISTNIAGMPEIINNGINGFLIKPGDKEALYKYMEFFIKNNNKIFSMGENAYNSLSEKFSKHYWGKEWIKVIEEI